MQRRFSSGLLILMLLLFPFLLLSQEREITGVNAPGNVSGYVFNYYGLAVSGAIVGTEEGPVTTSAANGFYLLEGVESGEQTLGCGKVGYNPSIYTVNIIPGDTLIQNFTLTQPVMVINPLSFEENLNPGEYISKSLNILNSGSGLLTWQAAVSFESMPSIPCNYSIALHDTWGDGWNGCSIDVLVNGIVVLNNITLNSGSGPAIFSFPVYSGDQITTDFSPGPFVTEPYYFIYDANGEQVWFSPAGNNGPPDVPPGQLIASCSSGQWLSLDNYEGTVDPFGGVENVITHLDASGTIAGEAFHASILFTSSPFVGEINVPVTMNIVGDEIFSPENVNVELDDPVSGKVDISWDWPGDAFQFFLIKRDGSIIATSTSLNYKDILPDNGYFCYSVQAVYGEGLSVPAGPACIEWPAPVLGVNPDDLEGSVWSGYSVDVFTTITNSGEGTLSYSFPEFAARDLLNHPETIKNKPGSPAELSYSALEKGDTSLDGAGYPVVLGAGGPDEFGYVWIDSDEDGGPGFDFTDISTTGTPVFGLSDDNIVGPFNIGFEFYFYGDVKTQFWINSNGCVGFTSTKITLQNTGLPTNSSVYNDFIAWMWDDLLFKQGASQVFYESFPDKLIIQFKNYGQFDAEGKYINAEVVLFKNGRIKLIYDDFSQGITLNSTTVGIQSSDPGLGLQVVFNSAYLHNDLSIVFSIPSGFISHVQPVSGVVPENSSELVTVTYSAESYLPGLYHAELLMETNDLNNTEFIIDNTMLVYLPAVFSGIVQDHDNDEPLNGVLVTAGPYQATTGENGEYSLFVDEGTYHIIFSKLGYMPLTIRDTSAEQGQITPLDISMWDMNYAPGHVNAEVQQDDHSCIVNWSLPDGPYEIIMDDGEAEDFFVFAHSGSWHAVKFTPAGYPSTVIGGSFHVGDGSFPGPFLGTDFGVAVFDDNGFNGLPGTMLDSTSVAVNNSGWVSLDWLNAIITDGSFYLAMFQSGNAPNAAPIGVDSQSPVQFKSYSKILGNDWALSPYQDFMIRAWVDGPEGDAASRDVVNYRISRYTDFDPEDPLAGGTYTELATTQGLVYEDSLIMPGWYAYGVKALYSSGQFSDYTLSNVVGNQMDVAVNVTTTLTTGDEPSGVEVTLQGLVYPHEVFSIITESDGIAAFDMVWKGTYNIKVSKTGFDTYLIKDVKLDENEEFAIILSEKKYSPGCFKVDPLTLVATWCPPLIVALNEDFESPDFPPLGWQTSPENSGWSRTNNGSGPSWIIPPWDSFYALAADYVGSSNDGCCDYLITPPLDLRESDSYFLLFDSFYDGASGQLAFVEYSFDAGASWETLHQLVPDPEWSKVEIDLASLAGNNNELPVWLAFHADDAGEWASGWAIDNVAVQVPIPAANYINFSVFLDNVFIGITSETEWNFAPLPYGQTYTASIAANYSSGLSSKVYDTFTSEYLFPPQDLTGIAPDDAAILTWGPPGTSVPTNLLGYNVYRDENIIAYLEHIGNWQMQGYVDEFLDPGMYDYSVTGVYDLSPYGFPGESGESMKEGPEEVIVDYCNPLEFIETWDVGGFQPNEWKTGGPNWSINGQAGNPPPVVEFTSEPHQTDYEIALESYPLCAAGMTEGQIWLDFDLELFSLNSTGEERLLVQVWEWENQLWQTMAEFNNSNGNIPLTKQHLNISQYAKDRIFKIKFLAKGLNSLDLRGWFIDNIHIFRRCLAPQNLTIDPDFSDGIRLTWELYEKSKPEGGSGTRQLIGFNIFRSVNGGDYELLANSAGMPYTDPDTNVLIGNVYCYKVNAVWESETDFCESELSNEVCVLWTAITDNSPDLAEGFNLFPNPASDRITISSQEIISRISIVHIAGIRCYDSMVAEKTLEIDLSGYHPGIYIIQCETASGVISRLLTIQR
jgi:hypothetical protein